ncbi:MAG: exodeoxyribonuclease VII large subunit [Proteobacteria bacterium]|nr:exodeoxyribonuclease VII large subunit [Pseudomonadota bacterium]
MSEAPAVHTAEREVFSPSQLVRAARSLLENAFPLIWVEGEISNFSRPASGHLYFSLKDAQAQVRCAMFKPKSTWLRFKPADGLRVLARARVGLYEARGEFQLIVEHLEEAGEGALLRAFAELKARLAAESLFDPSIKRAIPRLPRRIGVVTSPTGAAVRDVLSVIARRFPLAHVEILPVPVQGKDAPPAIVAMLSAASKARRHDVLLLTRGGGSLEDLWAFNDEAVARAIRACSIPVVSAIGHEIDFTIADFAADLRAPTPSAAAELLVPDANEIQRALNHVSARLDQWIHHRLHAHAQRTDHALARLRAQHPRQRLRLGRERLAQLRTRLHRLHPAGTLARHADTLRIGIERMRVQLAHRLHARELRLGELARALNAVSPLATLQRGYAILIDRDSGNVVRSIEASRRVDRFRARLADGEILLTRDT